MTQIVTDTLTNLITSFSFRRAISLIVILMIIGTAAWTVDYYTAFTRMYRLEKATALLERLHALDGKTLSPEIETVRRQIVNDLASQTAAPAETVNGARYESNSTAFAEWIKQRWLKIVAAATPWFLFSLVTVPGAFKGETSSIGGFFAFQVLTVFFGALGGVLPPVGNGFVDYVLLPGGIFVFVVILPIAVASITAFNKVRDSSKKKAIVNNLRMLAATADMFFLENGVSEVSYDRLVGPDSEKPIKRFTSIEGESYPTVFRQGEPIIAVRPSGEKIAWGT